MNDDLEPRLHDALHSDPLPVAPASLFDALERVPDAPVRVRTRLGGRPILGLFAAAAVLVVASAVALTGGATPRSGPSVATPGPSLAAAVPYLHLEYTAQTVDGVAPTPADMARIASVLHTRIDTLGVADPTVSTQDLVIVVDLPGVTDAADVETAGRLLGQTGKVDVVPLGETQATVGQPIDLTTFPPLFGGDQIVAAFRTDQNGSAAIDIVLKPDGTRLFGDYTASHIGSYFAITLDGVVLAAPVIQNAIPNGTVEITGGGLNGFDATQANQLVTMIGSGELPFPISLTSSAVIVPSEGPSLAASSPAPSDGDASPGPSRLHLVFTPVVTGPAVADGMAKVVAILQARIADAGVVGAAVEADGTGQIIVEIPGVTSSDDTLVNMLPMTGHVNLIALRDGQVSIDLPIDPTVNPSVLPDGAVDSVTEDLDPAGVATFHLELSPDAATAFAGYVAAHAGSSYAIVIDGHVLLAPVTLRDLADGVLTVTADDTVVDPSDARVRAILAILQTGPLPFDLKSVSTEVVPEQQSCPSSARCAAPSPAVSTP